MTESVLDYMTRLGRAAREASRVLARASTAQKNRALQAAAAALDAARDELVRANELDRRRSCQWLDAAMLDRPALTPKVIDGMIEGLRRSPRCLIRSARFATCVTCHPASVSARCGYRWAWWASSTNRGPT